MTPATDRRILHLTVRTEETSPFEDWTSPHTGRINALLTGRTDGGSGAVQTGRIGVVQTGGSGVVQTGGSGRQ